MNKVLGIDIGGTKIHAALIDEQGNVLAEQREPTQTHSQSALLLQLQGLCARLDPEGVAQVVGVGVPASVCPRTQTLHQMPNLSVAEGVGFVPALQSALGRRVLVGNDVNVAALGEAWLGQGGEPFALIAIGTGIGMGMVCGGNIINGARGAAGEIAYLPLGAALQREALQAGMFEARLGGAGWLARYRELGGRQSALLADLFAAPDEVFEQVLHENAAWLAQGILAIRAVLDPERFCLAGSIGLQPRLLAATTEALCTYGADDVALSAATLGQAAGVLGAAKLALGYKEASA